MKEIIFGIRLRYDDLLEGYAFSLINQLREYASWANLALLDTDSDNPNIVRCVVTYMPFLVDDGPHKLVLTGIGPVWKGLWLGELIKYNEFPISSNGKLTIALLPGWLSRTLSTFGFDISKTDVDTSTIRSDRSYFWKE